MKRTRRLLGSSGASLAMLTLLAGAVSACGGGDGVEATAHADPGVDSTRVGEASADAAEAQELPSLLTALDSLPESTRRALEPWTGDLLEMEQRRVIRLLTVYEPQYFGFDGHRQIGIVAEAAADLEKFLNDRLDRQRLKMVVVIQPVTRDLLLPFLEEGRGDIAAAGLTITPERLEMVDFTNPLATGVSEVLVTGPGVEAPAGIDDLGALELHVNPSSSFWESLQALDERLKREGRQALNLVAANEVLSAADLLEQVAAGNSPATVVDDFQGKFWAQIFPELEIHPHLAVRTEGSIGWAIRKNSPGLRDALNEFVRNRRQGTLTGNILIRRYTQDTARVQRVRRAEHSAALTRLKELFQKHAAAYDLDWVLLVAQAFQESRLGADTKSGHGAVGIMQIKPASAAEAGVHDISTDDGNIKAGAAYLRHLIDNYFDDPALDATSRQVFA
ncbi:MAG: lytic transglycosylase F, partial [Gemmatimonadetes bacterium]|nr:lytic transglycosylase F [Gemmatimonadota bacterium]